MKKLLTLLCISVASCVLSITHAVEPQKLTLPGELYYALDGDKRYFASLEEIGSDARITIYNADFSIKEQFTVEGVISYEIKTSEYNGEKYKKYTAGVDIINFNLDFYDNSGIIASRGIFTQDGSWVILVSHVNELERNYYLYSSKNKKICPLQSRGYIALSEIANGTPYYYTTEEVSNELDGQYLSDSITTIWSFNDVNGVITPTAIASSVKAFPNPLPAGTTLKIDLNREADNNTILTITDLDGRQEYRKRVRPGETSVQVSPKFSHGLHIYTIIYSNGESYSGKVAAE